MCVCLVVLCVHHIDDCCLLFFFVVLFIVVGVCFCLGGCSVVFYLMVCCVWPLCVMSLLFVVSAKYCVVGSCVF